MIRHLFLSPGHNFFGHHGKPPGTHRMVAVDAMECVAGRGILHDRFFDHKAEYKGQITFFAWENLTQLWRELGVGSQDPSALRRNVITEGLDLSALIGREFSLEGVQFFGSEECRPCYWMNQAVHADAEAWLRGRGGLRARILTDGILRVADKE